jgi:hypothetical protein
MYGIDGETFKRRAANKFDMEKMFYAGTSK